jgi:hypothetical protein
MFEIKTQHNAMRYKNASALKTYEKYLQIKDGNWNILKDGESITFEELEAAALVLDTPIKITTSEEIGIWNVRSKPTTGD